MTQKNIFFNDALKTAASIVGKINVPEDIIPLFIRDIHGRIRIAIDSEKEKHGEIAAHLDEAMGSLGAFANKVEKRVLFRDDFFDPESIFRNPDILETYLPGSDTSLRLLDRQIIGQEWLRPNNQDSGAASQHKPPRLVFYGLKGGIGRSTALALLAYELAGSGKRVLLIDFDLESPGLSGMLLPPDHLSDFGLVDWFIEDGVGQGDAVLGRMISPSPLSENTQGEIRIAAAMGLEEEFYLSKLSRVYADLPKKDGGIERFSQRVSRLLETLEAQEKPDVVLIDSRAGLHDLAAVSIVGLATFAFLFAVDTAQTWQGYRLLFSHWQAHPTVLRAVRDRLITVEALFPESDQSMRADRFLDHSYKLFSETLYEKIEPGRKQDPDIFNFDINDDSAPHYPLRIKWNSRFQEFEPLLLPKGILTNADIAASFGNFLEGAKRLIGGEAL